MNLVDRCRIFHIKQILLPISLFSISSFLSFIDFYKQTTKHLVCNSKNPFFLIKSVDCQFPKFIFLKLLAIENDLSFFQILLSQNYKHQTPRIDFELQCPVPINFFSIFHTSYSLNKHFLVCEPNIRATCLECQKVGWCQQFGSD